MLAFSWGRTVAALLSVFVFTGFGGLNGVAQTNEWTWMGGSSTTRGNSGPAPVYGVLGLPASGNTPGGRGSSASWADRNGNLWLFSGGTAGPNGLEIDPNDLWMFNASTNQWTWVGGNTVASCGQVVTLCGNPGVYGTLGVAAAGNLPGSRYFTQGAVDADGNLWMFGGIAEDARSVWGSLNDLWMYNPATSQWTWVSGSNDAHCCSGINGIYGTLGTPAPGNAPGGRHSAASWVDKKGNFWLFGGLGNDAAFNGANLNDLWKFDPSIKEWTWMGGSDVGWGTGGRPGVYGTRGTPSSANVPGSRTDATSWTDSGGNLWLFGGYGYDARNTLGYLNDLWRYDTATNEWTWMAGDSVMPCPVLLCGQWGLYGQLGVPDAANMPGGRFGAAVWSDAGDNFWLFAGKGMDVDGQFGFLNDLWVYVSASNEWKWMGGNTFTANCATYDQAFTYCGGLGGAYGDLEIPGAGNLPGSRASAYPWTGSDGDLWLFGGSGFDSLDVNGTLNDLWRYTPSLSSLPPVPLPILGVPSGTYSTGGALPVVDAMATAVIHYTTDGSTPTETSSIYTDPITVGASETVKAMATAVGYPSSGVATGVYVVLPAAATPVFSVPAGTYTSTQTVSVSDATSGATIYYTTDGTSPTTSSTVYSGPITVSATESIEAIAIAPGYAASSVATAMYTISLPPAFALAESANALTIASSGQGTVTLTVTPQNGFNSAVSFACSGLPAGAICTFNPTTVTPTSGAATTTLTIFSAAQSAALQSGSTNREPEIAVALLIGLFGLLGRRKLLAPALFLGLGLGLTLVTACGGSGGTSNGGTARPTPTVSAVTVTATSGALQQSVKLTLTVD